MCEYAGPGTVAENGANALPGRGAGNRDNAKTRQGKAPGTRPRAIASPCNPPPTRPLPRHQPAPLRAISLARARPQQSRLHIGLQAVRPGPRFHAFPPHHLGTRLRPFSLPGLGLEGLGYFPKCVYFEIRGGNALVRVGYPRGSPTRLRHIFFQWHVP